MNKGYTREIKGNTCTHTHTKNFLKTQSKKKIYKAARGKKNYVKSATIKLTSDSQQKPPNNSTN